MMSDDLKNLLINSGNHTFIETEVNEATCQISSSEAINGGEIEYALLRPVASMKVLEPSPASSENSNLQAMLRKLACNLCEALVSHTSELRIEATVGVTVDGGARVILLHFDDRVSRVCAPSVSPIAESKSTEAPFQVMNDNNVDKIADTFVKTEVIDSALSSTVDVLTFNGCSSCVGSNEDNTEQGLLRQLLCAAPVLKHPTISADDVPVSTQPVKRFVGTSRFDGNLPCKSSARSTILGKLLTSPRLNDSYMRNCHPQTVATRPRLSSSHPVHRVQEAGVNGRRSNASADGGVGTSGIKTNTKRKQDDDSDWEPPGRSGYRCQKQRACSSGVVVSRAEISDQQAEEPFSGMMLGQTNQYQFSNLLHHLVEQNMSADNAKRMKPSAASGCDASEHQLDDHSRLLIKDNSSSLQSQAALKLVELAKKYAVKEEIEDTIYSSEIR